MRWEQNVENGNGWLTASVDITSQSEQPELIPALSCMSLWFWDCSLNSVNLRNGNANSCAAQWTIIRRKRYWMKKQCVNCNSTQMLVFAFMVTVEWLTRTEWKAEDCDHLQGMLLYTICLVILYIRGTLEGGNHVWSLLSLWLTESSAQNVFYLRSSL